MTDMEQLETLLFDWTMGVPSTYHVYRVVSMILLACLAIGIIGTTSAFVFAPIPSCTRGWSSFAGIVCVGGAITGKVLHCVLNEHFQTGQVCSEWTLISAGRCPRYMEQNSGIDDFACIGNECSRKWYQSYEVYKYPACLNSSLYIKESTPAQADTTEQPGSCNDCVDKDSNGQPMSCAMPVVIAVFVLVAFIFALMLLEYGSGKSSLGMIIKLLKNVSCGHSTTGAVQVPQRETEQPAQEELSSGQGSAAGTNQQHQPV